MKYQIFFLILLLSSCSLLQSKKTDPSVVFLKNSYLEIGFTRRPASISGGIENCLILCQKIMGNYFVKDDFAYSGKQLSDVQIDRLVDFTMRAGRKMEKGDEIIIWEPEMMRMGEAVGGEGIPQFVKENGTFEKDLLSDSLIDTKPREVLQMRLHYDDGTIRIFKKIYGNAKSVDFSEAERDFKVTTHDNLTDIEYIEIAHTHPTYALTVVSKDGKRFSRANELSQGDYATIAEFLDQLPSGKKLSIKAITPNGFYYESSFIAP